MKMNVTEQKLLKLIRGVIILNQYMINELEKLGYKAKIVSAKHATELIEEIDTRHKVNQIYSKIYDAYLNFNANGIEEKDSLLIVAKKWPITNLIFNWKNKELKVTVPPVYIGLDLVDKLNEDISDLFAEKKYSLSKCFLPLKLLAGRSTLGRYGRNNIMYIDGFGSFHTLRCFYTDMPCEEDTFIEPELASACTNCGICIAACPTGAISKEKFIVNTEKCLSWQNEVDGVFEEWVEPSWHNSLMGCIQCQGKCPMNKQYLSDIRTYPAFTEEETMAFYKADPLEKLSHETQEKLKTIEFYDNYGVFVRNLKLLIDNVKEI
jgi:epoxyqueuosine reductase